MLDANRGFKEVKMRTVVVLMSIMMALAPLGCAKEQPGKKAVAEKTA